MLDKIQNFPLVSIVTPTYNQADYLAETIESVLAQDYPNIEYIVLDDGSTDGTPEILKRYDGRIRHERHENIGQANTLNKGWAMARGTYIGYLSSDDLLYPSAVRKLVDRIDRDSFIVCTFPDADLINSHSLVIKKNVCQHFDLVEIVVRQSCYIGPGALFRKSAFEVIGGWRPELTLAPDREFWIRLAAEGRFAMYDEVLAGYRMHPRSLSYKIVSEEASCEYLLVLDKYFCAESIPPAIAERKAEAYGYAYLLIARNCFRAGHLKRGIELYSKACLLHPKLRSVWVKLRILRNVVSRPIRMGISTFVFYTKHWWQV